ncbi:hypothetical protein GIB67_032027 [Kingdonia uniflora]|uniref:Uncharacterized protein n=1 Tax=Kingdonia uniflora TaxID=39325 RepID=A0A7J7MWK4_9MAGN|nr:hypothetical protein GIB67_032027 [Kingdonia uniflora]
MDRVQLYVIVYFEGNIVRPNIGSIISYVGGSAKLTSLRLHSSFDDFVILSKSIVRTVNGCPLPKILVQVKGYLPLKRRTFAS